MKVSIEPHTLLRATERGATEEEIKDALENGQDMTGKSGRLGKSKVFTFRQIRNGKFYEEKKLEVFYVIEKNTFVTVTVYVFYGKF